MTAVEVSIAVPVKDRRDRMLRCLDALIAQRHPSFEVIVLDNGSTDGTAEACLERGRGAPVAVRVERVPGTLGRVRNHAASVARGEFIAFTDSDCIPHPDWISAAVRELRSDPGLGFVCGPTRPAEVPARAWAQTVNVVRPSRRFESCNVVFRARAFGPAGAFDEVVGDGWEDTSAGFEMLRRGWRVRFVTDALVWHDVTYPGFWWHVRREQRQTGLARAARRYPELRRELLFARLFIGPRPAACFAAAVGLAAGARWPRARALALPYVPYVLARVLPWRMAQIVVLDLAMHAAVVRGAVRYRSLVL